MAEVKIERGRAAHRRIRNACTAAALDGPAAGEVARTPTASRSSAGRWREGPRSRRCGSSTAAGSSPRSPPKRRGPTSPRAIPSRGGRAAAASGLWSGRLELEPEFSLDVVAGLAGGGSLPAGHRARRAQPLAVAAHAGAEPGDADHDRAQRLEVAGLAAQLPPRGRRLPAARLRAARRHLLDDGLPLAERARRATCARSTPSAGTSRAGGWATAPAALPAPVELEMAEWLAAEAVDQLARALPGAGRGLLPGGRRAGATSPTARYFAEKFLLDPVLLDLTSGDLPRRPRADPRPRLPRPAQLGLRLEREARRPRLRARRRDEQGRVPGRAGPRRRRGPARAAGAAGATPPTSSATRT